MRQRKLEKSLSVSSLNPQQQQTFSRLLLSLKPRISPSLAESIIYLTETLINQEKQNKSSQLVEDLNEQLLQTSFDTLKFKEFLFQVTNTLNVILSPQNEITFKNVLQKLKTLHLNSETAQINALENLINKMNEEKKNYELEKWAQTQILKRTNEQLNKIIIENTELKEKIKKRSRGEREKEKDKLIVFLWQEINSSKK
ncbi:Hypothetical_protein [Hexamita inflata]|uniref:Hypothetical_protein n=1 Tax=Hexamita inflata TaxID=28002 RepID=A0AA86USM5_9EUKA|nr:Hypothetical protein HINF_LOCUS50957 [Hexamita inflata]